MSTKHKVMVDTAKNARHFTENTILYRNSHGNITLC